MKKIILLLLALTFIIPVTACNKKRDTTIQIDNGSTKMIAHRGLSGIEVENTYSAFKRAGEHSYYGIEADVRRTADGKFIICHDDDLERISGQKIDVESSNFSDLINVPLFDRYKNTAVGERLTGLENFILVCKQYEKQAILEFKSNFTQQEIDEIIEIIRNLDYLERVTFISFNYNDVLYVRQKLPTQRVQYLFSKPSDEITEKLIRDKIDVGINHKSLTKDLLNTYHDAGLEVNCWTVDSKLRAKQLIKLGVDYLTSNILE